MIQIESTLKEKWLDRDSLSEAITDMVVKYKIPEDLWIEFEADVDTLLSTVHANIILEMVGRVATDLTVTKTEEEDG